MTPVVGAVLIGVLVGVVVGALGAGGGILAVPALVYFLGVDPHDATAASLVIVGVTALAALPHRARVRQVDWREGWHFGLLGSVGSFLGARLNALVSGPVLLYLFAALLAIVSVAMAVKGWRDRRPSQPNGSEPALQTGRRSASGWVKLVLAATGTGMLTGFFGVGGGFIVVPMLVLALRHSIRQAAGTSLLVMVIASVVGLLSRLGTGIEVPWQLTVALTAGSALGGVLGGPLSGRARPATLTLIFAGLLAAVSAGTLAATMFGPGG